MILSNRICVRNNIAASLWFLAFMSGGFNLKHANAQDLSSKKMGVYLQQNASKIGTINAIVSYPGFKGAVYSPVVALLSVTPKKQNAIYVMAIEKNKLTTIWKSDKLPSSFSVLDVNDFKIEQLNGEDYLALNGCAPHLCGGFESPGYNGVFLYSLSARKAYFAAASGNPTCIDSYTNLKSAGPEIHKAVVEYVNRTIIRSSSPINIEECSNLPKGSITKPSELK